MAGIFSRTPTGLLGLLDAKTLGKNPSELLDSLQAVIDLQPFIAATRGYSQENATATATTVGEFAAVTVPAQKIWLVCNVSSQLTAATTGDDAVWYPTTDYQHPTLRWILTEGGISRVEVNFQSTTAVAFRGRQFEKPLLAVPGQRFFTHIEKRVIAAAGFAVSTNVAFIDVDI